MADTTLLLVEDEPDLLDLLGFSLERAGYRVETAPRVKRAWRRPGDSTPT